MAIIIMQDNKITLIQSLKTQQKYQNLRFDQLLSILSDDKFTLHQTRKYLLHVYPSLDISWRNMTQEDISTQFSQCKEYIENQRKYWNDQTIAYKTHSQVYNKQNLQVKKKLNLQQNVTQKQLFQNLTKSLEQQNTFINFNRNLHGNEQIINEYHSFKQFYEHLQKIINYEYNLSKYETIYDNELQRQITDIVKEHNDLLAKQASQYDKLIEVNDRYEKEMAMLKSKVRQIFLFYCRQHNLKSLSFEDMNRYSRLLDLRLFLLYIKDYKYLQNNKYKYNLGKVTEIFKKYATNTHDLSFQQFWKIHVELFQMKVISINRKQLLDTKKEMIQWQKQKYRVQNGKMQELRGILLNNKMAESYKYDYKYQNLKTQFSNLKKASSVAHLGLKNSPSKVTESSQFTNLNKKSLPSSKDSQLSSMNRNFIQQIRQQIKNQQKGIHKNNSYKNIAERSNPQKITSIHLPKILKMSTEEISNQGIYQSLKKFPAFDFLAQEKKIRGIMGLSVGEDEQFVSQLMSKQLKLKKQLQRQNTIKRQQKRKQVISQSKVHKHQCRKYHPEQVQPYMRF